MKRVCFFNQLRSFELAYSKLQPELEVTVRDLELGVEGYVVVSNTLASRGSTLGRVGKGGTRITPSLSFDEIKMLADIMSLKNAAAGLPLGGAKSGLKADPSAPDFEKKFRRFVSLVKPLLVENGGIWGGFGFDIGMKTEHLIWACEETGSNKCATGKPAEMGGTDYDKEGIAGLGVAVAAATLLREQERDISKVTFSVQGVGAMGAAVIKYFTEYGASLRAVADPILEGGYCLDADPSPELYKCLSCQDFESAKLLLAKEGTKLASVEQVLFADCDLLFPAAIQGVVNESNVNKVKAKYLVEAANNPCTGNSRDNLHSQGTLVIPDFIANPGGIIAAYIEMTSKVTAEENLKTKKNVSDAKSYTKQKIEENTLRLLEIIKTLDVTPLQAGRYLALSAIFKNAPQLIDG